ncbi:MAG: hypothetical protein MUP02_07070, partial [Actinobacteria bacterium]|nr:hypothetical protein [Actinomycetota bacterium]
LAPEISHYLMVKITAKNTSSVDYPAGTAAIKWNPVDDETTGTDQQKFKIYIDGMSHNYYVPIGESRYWTGTGNISNLVLEIPQIEGVKIEIGQILLKKRIAYPADIYISKKIQDISGGATRTINPFLIPTYILLFQFLILSAVFFFLFRSYYIKQGRKISRVIKKAVLIFIISILLLFSVSFAYTEIITVKSYWDSYKKHIIAGSLDETYFGFYDFEKFIMWADDTIPEGMDIIVFIRGEPVYIMSEMAYNLYPRDIKFINISGRTFEEINSEIESINKSYKDIYEYLIVLSEDDTASAFRFELLARYRTTGGFIYKIK